MSSEGVTAPPPDPAGSLADVLPAALALLRGETEADPLRLLDRLGPRRQVVVLLVDGFGTAPLRLAARTVPLFADAVAGRAGTVLALQAPFPSTTPTSLVTLGTGRLPGVHGILGFTVRVPGTDRVLTHIAWRGEPPSRSWQPVPRLLETAADGGVATAVVSDPAYAGSPLTEAAYGRARYRAAAPGSATAAAVAAELAAGTGLVLAYHAALDTAAHRHGLTSRQWRAEARGVARLIEQLVAGLPPDAALLVTADHGMLDIPRDARFDMDADRRLSSGVRLVAGEPRVRYLHTVDGARDDVIATWREVLGAAADVRPREQLVEAGWFGPVTSANIDRIGDVVVVCREPVAVLAGAHEPPEVARLVGMHGAATDAERSIPLWLLTR